MGSVVANFCNGCNGLILCFNLSVQDASHDWMLFCGGPRVFWWDWPAWPWHGGLWRRKHRIRHESEYKEGTLCSVHVQTVLGSLWPSRIAVWLMGCYAGVIDAAIPTASDSASKWMFLAFQALRELITVRNVLYWFILSVSEPKEKGFPLSL